VWGLFRHSCGLILCDPERVFPELKAAYPWISQIAAVPLYDAGKMQIGALWLAQHAGASRFSDEQCAIAQRLAMPLVCMIKVLELLDQRSSALRSACEELERERHYRELAESAFRESQQALEFKEAEVREVHHRVKNTIQMAATVLKLQARTTASGEVRATLRDAEDRLRSLAAVHELLQADAGIVRAVAMPKLLRIVIDALQYSFVEHCRVNVQLRADSVMVASSAAIPLALIANEAITNAYKHAFVESGSGELMVILRRLGDNGLMLQVRDNGIGVASNGTGKRGLGLTLMEGSAQQLGGVISLKTPEQGCGTLLTLTVQNLAGGVQLLAAHPSGA
jgi:two-component sensor histidine kinase